MEPDQRVIAEALLHYLERHLGSPGLSYADAPRRIAVGTEAWILAFSLRGAPPGSTGPMVLRLMFDARSADDIRIEHAVQNAVAEQGFPAPMVIASSPTADVLGRPFMVMTHLPGEHRPDLPDAVELQMQALAALHGLDAGPVDRAFQAHQVPEARRSGSIRAEEATAQVRRNGLARYEPLLDWLDQTRPVKLERSVCHGDAHLANMLFEDGRVSALLDWGTARLNDPGMDVGLLCGYARCGRYPSSDGGDPAQRAVDRLCTAYERHQPLDASVVDYFETEFLVSVLVDMTDRHIRRRAGEAVAANPLLDDPASATLVQERLAQSTGMSVPSPMQAAA